MDDLLREAIPLPEGLTPAGVLTLTHLRERSYRKQEPQTAAIDSQWPLSLGLSMLDEDDASSLLAAVHEELTGCVGMRIAGPLDEDVLDEIETAEDDDERGRLMQQHAPWQRAAVQLEVGRMKRRLLELLPDIVLSLN